MMPSWPRLRIQVSPDKSAFPYATKHSIHIAVVSADADMKMSCDRFSKLLYFPSLPKLIEAFLSESDQVENFINLINADPDHLTKALGDELDMWGTFRHTRRSVNLLKSVVEGIDIVGQDIIALGDHECTIAFDATFDAFHEVEWTEEAPEWYLSSLTDSFTEQHSVSGTAKLKFSENSEQIISCHNLEVDSLEFEVETRPSGYGSHR